ncbi:MAG: hypothetical protein JOY82_24015 [Streptosporangiaceae bacterium]|nr:hypothetical protein [Streptosporangiaceae bacterium]MBV9857549.1 hypothetical protein [Streptosporangiaceae bacterium]
MPGVSAGAAAAISWSASRAPSSARPAVASAAMVSWNSLICPARRAARQAGSRRVT